ncbi:hypothetical protein AAV35_006520 [Salimicrobium jeotgali]|uniref:Uncharacterized protein n=1 Tax=Salimicrobium jeotgali TaxID=1230341 RepID=K2FPA2_9BACI|nr:hypothetical protein [Salimicrobium jeotgali]AKG04473.1 hypothetical protein AAV35_006520 [Salimicrobium jeotgali]EKE32681.1 hypothetical protein MJ3_01947 [Salimicrobium jeotgali]MBM7695333.1 FtsH-binding integral membrane protein [Salimicrobium jeotgali]
MEPDKQTLKTLSIIGYILISGSIAGYFGYYLQYEDSFIWHWVIMSLIGVVLLGVKNYKLQTNQLKTVILDLLFIFALPLIANIDLPNGLAILLMTVIAGILATTIMQLTFKPWQET